MHRFFIRPESLGYQPNIYNRWDDPRWCALVEEFRWSIRLREWKEIDRRLRLLVKVEDWDKEDVLLIANQHRDMLLVDAYIKAGFLEEEAIIVFADNSIPWQRLRPFRAVLRGDPHQNCGAVAEGERKRARKTPIEVLKDPFGKRTLSLDSRQPNRRSGDPDIVAGESLSRPKQGDSELSVQEPSSLRTPLAGRSKDVTGAERSRPRLTEKSEGETSGI